MGPGPPRRDWAAQTLQFQEMQERHRQLQRARAAQNSLCLDMTEQSRWRVEKEKRSLLHTKQKRSL